jgi:hypothetical protein
MLCNGPSLSVTFKAPVVRRISPICGANVLGNCEKELRNEYWFAADTMASCRKGCASFWGSLNGSWCTKGIPTLKHDHLQCQRTVMDAVEIFYEGVTTVSTQAQLRLERPPISPARGANATRARRNKALVDALGSVKAPPIPHGAFALNGTKCRFGITLYQTTYRHGMEARIISLQNAVAHASAAVERVRSWLLTTAPDKKVEATLRLWIATIEQDCMRVINFINQLNKDTSK